MKSPALRSRVVGESAPWRSTVRELAEVAAFTDANVLIKGESGTGKELIAQLVHELDRRRTKRRASSCSTARRSRPSSPAASSSATSAARSRARSTRGRRVRAGQRRHAVPRRDRRAAAGAAGAAAARGAGAPVQARRQQRLAAHRVSPRVCHAPRPRGRAWRTGLPRRSLSPHRGMGLPRAAAARTARGHPAAGDPFPVAAESTRPTPVTVDQAVQRVSADAATTRATCATCVSWSRGCGIATPAAARSPSATFRRSIGPGTGHATPAGRMRSSSA